jgi:glycosyltransferase involved in cell wall biosynthesis
MFTVDDIHIFIFTHNRANYLKASIESLLNQTAGVNQITVLDNASTDDTQTIVESYADRGVLYVKTACAEGNFSFYLGNFNTAKQLVNKTYMMLFHDDDLLHPQYLEFALQQLNTYKNLSLITTRYTDFQDQQVPTLTNSVSSNAYLFENQQAFAHFLYFNEVVCFAPAIYRTDALLATPIDVKRYGKFFDWPFMVDVTAHGSSAIFEDLGLIWVRRHPQQETTNTAFPYTLENVINWDVCFYHALKISPRNRELYLKFILKMFYFVTGKYQAFVAPTSSESMDKAILRGILNSPMEISISILLEALQHSSLVNVVRQKPLHWRERLKEIIRRPRTLFSR